MICLLRGEGWHFKPCERYKPSEGSHSFNMPALHWQIAGGLCWFDNKRSCFSLDDDAGDSVL